MGTKARNFGSAAALILAGSALAAPPATHPAAGRAQIQIEAHRAEARAGAFDAFALRDVIVDMDGSEHVRFDRTYKGLPVIGGDIVIHSDARGAFRSASLTLHDALRLETTARFDDGAAVQYAQSLFTGAADGAPRSRLVVYARGAQPALAYDVTIGGESDLRRGDLLYMPGHVLIYAGGGEVIHASDGVMMVRRQVLAEFMAGRGFDFGSFVVRRHPAAAGS